MNPNFVSKSHAWCAISAIVWVLAAGTGSAQSLAITGAVAYPSASAAPTHRATVLTKDGRIVAVGSQVQIPPGYDVIRCEGCAIVAGFWNSHVHFTEPKWDAADKQLAQKLSDQLQSMLTRSGFHHCRRYRLTPRKHDRASAANRFRRTCLGRGF